VTNRVALVAGQTTRGGEAIGCADSRSPDLRRMLQLGLATVWLLDGLLQLQPFMFTAHFGAMLRGTAAGNPQLVARSIIWNAGIVGHHSVVTNATFALVQVLLGLGIAWRMSLKAALAASIAWSLGIWWFGEGLGGVLSGNASPIGGGPGAVLVYALVALLLWPADRVGSDPPFAAARALGIAAARAIWALLWGGLACLTLVGNGRSSEGVHDLLKGLAAGEPRWLAALDLHLASVLAHRGVAVSVSLAALFTVVAVAVYLPSRAARVSVAAAVLLSLVIWVIGENFGAVLGGGQATDPNSGPLLILFSLSYWPARPRMATRDEPATAVALETS